MTNMIASHKKANAAIAKAERENLRLLNGKCKVADVRNAERIAAEACNFASQEGTEEDRASYSFLAKDFLANSKFGL